MIGPKVGYFQVSCSVSIVPAFVPTQQTDGHICARPATCYDYD